MCPEEESPLEPWNRKVQLDVQVEVVASNGAVDEVLGEREDRRRRERRVKLRSDVGERTDGRLQILQISHQVGLGVVDQPGGGVAEFAQAVQSGRQAWPLRDQHIESGRHLSQRLSENFALCCEGAANLIQCLNGRDDVVTLLVECPHESVEPVDQIADGGRLRNLGTRSKRQRESSLATTALKSASRRGARGSAGRPRQPPPFRNRGNTRPSDKPAGSAQA